MQKYLMVAGLNAKNRQRIIHKFFDLDESVDLNIKFDPIAQKYKSSSDNFKLEFLTAFPITESSLEKIEFGNNYLWLKGYFESRGKVFIDDVADGWDLHISIAIYDIIIKYYPQCENMISKIMLDCDMRVSEFHIVPENFNVGRCRLNYYLAFLNDYLEKGKEFSKTFNNALEYIHLEENSNRPLIEEWLKEKLTQLRENEDV